MDLTSQRTSIEFIIKLDKLISNSEHEIVKLNETFNPVIQYFNECLMAKALSRVDILIFFKLCELGWCEWYLVKRIRPSDKLISSSWDNYEGELCRNLVEFWKEFHSKRNVSLWCWNF